MDDSRYGVGGGVEQGVTALENLKPSGSLNRGRLNEPIIVASLFRQEGEIARNGAYLNSSAFCHCLTD